MIDTLAVADAETPKGQSEGRQSEDTDLTPDTRPATSRIVGAVALFVAAAVVMIIIFWLSSDSLAINVLLVAVAAILTGFASVVLPTKLRDRSVPFVVIAAGTAGLLATVLAIPSLRSTQQMPSADTSSESPAGTTSPTPSTTASEPDPFTWDFNFHADGYCEGFVVKNWLLKSPPKGDKLNAEWAYQNGGATANGVIALTIQGKSDAAVVIENLYVVDVQMEEVSSDFSVVYPCNPGGGPLTSRYFKVVLDKRPRLKQYPGTDIDDQPTEPIKKFPYKVTKDDVERFNLVLGSSGPACICSWRLALDWTSGGRSGRTIIDRKFSSIRTFVPDPGVKNGYYERTTGTEEWYPPLPN